MLIDKQTKISLFTVFGALPVVIGAIVWLTVIYYKTEASEKANVKQDIKIEAQYNLLLDIRDRVIRIEENQKK